MVGVAGQDRRHSAFNPTGQLSRHIPSFGSRELLAFADEAIEQIRPTYVVCPARRLVRRSDMSGFAHLGHWGRSFAVMHNAIRIPGRLPVTQDALVARLGLEIGISLQEVSDFHLDGLREQGTRPVA